MRLVSTTSNSSVQYVHGIVEDGNLSTTPSTPISPTVSISGAGANEESIHRPFNRRIFGFLPSPSVSFYKKSNGSGCSLVGTPECEVRTMNSLDDDEPWSDFEDDGRKTSADHSEYKEDMSMSPLISRTVFLFNDNWRYKKMNHLTKKFQRTRKKEIVKQQQSEDSIMPAPLKRIVQRSTLKPQLKAFKRILDELQNENMPLETEVKHEAIITHNLKDELIPSIGNLTFLNQPQKHDDVIKKSQLIAKANQTWNSKNKKEIVAKCGKIDKLNQSLKRKSMDYLEVVPNKITSDSKRRAIESIGKVSVKGGGNP